MACDDSASTVELKPGVRGAGYCLFGIQAVDALPTPDPEAKGAIYSLGRSETLKKFHSHVLPLSGEKA